MSLELSSGLGALAWLARSSVQAAVLALLVLAVQGLLRGHLTPAWRYRLWLLVVLRLILPFSLPSDLSIFNLVPARPAASRASASTPPAPAAGPARVVPASPVFPPGIVDLTPAELSGPPAEAMPPRRTVPSAASSDAGRLSSHEVPEMEPGGLPGAEPLAVVVGSWTRWRGWLGWVWLGGVGVLAARLLGQNLSFARRVERDRGPVAVRLTRLVDECRSALGVRGPVSVCETGAVRSPALYGLFRPTLLLPRGLADRFSDDELRHVLLHELGHVRRHDLPVNGVVAVLQMLHWFNPVLWFAFRRMQADRELATDALALEAAGEGRARSYGETILKLLESFAHPASAPSALGILEDRAQMRDRMRRIAGYRRPSRWSVLAAVPVALLALVTLTDPRIGGTPDANAAEKAETAPRAGAGFVPVDLSRHVVTAWSTVKPGSSWDAVPKGRQVVGDVPFEFAGLVEVAGTGGLEYNRDHPTRANAIRVGRPVAALHLLHGAGFAVPDRTTIARLVLHYANGQSRELPIRYGEHVRNWWDEPNDESDAVLDAQTRVGWTGRSPETDAFKVGLRLFHTRFANPLPDQVVESVDLVSTLSRCSEVLLGLTVEEPGAPVPAVFAAAAGTAAGPAAGEFFPVPLKAFCTRTYEVIDQDPDSSWAYAPHGRHVFNGVLFELPGVMEVSGLGAARDDNPLPTSIRDIPLGRKARRLHLLHGGAADLGEGTPLAKLVLHYADGREHTLSLVYGVNVRNWYKGGDKKDQVTDPNTKLGWTGDSPRSRRFGSTLRIYQTAFDLPWPDVELKSVDFVSLLSESVSVVPGMTLESGAAQAASTPAPAVAEAPAGGQPASTEVRIRVLDAGTGKPVEGATARLRATDGRREYKFGEQRATTRGELVLDVLNGGPTNRAVTVRAPGYLAAESTVPNPTHIKGLALTVRLKPGVRVGGRVTDPDNRPIAGATVVIRGLTRDEAGQVLETALDTVTTDDSGHWSTGSVPPPGENLSFQVTHPDFLPGEFEQTDAYANATDAEAPTIERLKAATARFVLDRAPDVMGRVGKADGDTPVANAEVVVASGLNFVNRRFARTGVDGRFRIPVPELGPAQVLVQTPGFAPSLTAVDVERSTPSLRVALAPARRLRGQVEDDAGRPVAGAWLYVANWRDVNLLTWRVETDAEGRFAWDAAPRESFRLVADKVGFDQVQQGVPAADGEATTEVRVLMGRGFVFTGKAVDAETRKPVSGLSVMYTWILGGGPGQELGWESVPHDTEADGRFSVSIGARGRGVGGSAVKLMVSAPGYRPEASPEFPSQGFLDHTFELRRGKPLAGLVVGTDGQPVAGAQIGLIGLGYLQLQSGGLGSFGSDSALNMTRSQEDGRFTLLGQVPAPRLVAVHPERGYAEVTGEELEKTGRLVLQPWGRIEGVLRIGNRPGTNESVFLNPASVMMGPQRLQYDFSAYRVQTDGKDGRFAIDHVPPGERQLVRLVPLGPQAWAHSQPLYVEVKPGETTRVTWGGTGRPVVGRVVASDPAVKVEWTSGHSSMSSKFPAPALTSPAGANQWFQSEAGRAWSRSFRQFTPVFAADGSFRIDDVPAGDYQAHFNFVDPESQKTGTFLNLGWANRDVTVPEIPGGRSDEPLDLGTIQVAIQSPEALKNDTKATQP